MAQKKSNQKNSAKNKTKTVTKAAQSQLDDLQQKKHREIAAIVLLVLGIVSFLLAVIRGESGWSAIHNFVLGISGFCAFIIPVLLIYLAVIISTDKFSNMILAKSIEVALLLLFLSSAIFLFKGYDGSSFSGFSDAVIEQYNNSDPLGSGVLGTLLGFPLGAALGPTGGKIIAIIATITDLMIITGTTVSKLTQSAQKVHVKAKSDIEEMRLKKAERKEREAAEQRELDDLAYDESKIYRTKKQPDLDIYDPNPDVLTGEKSKRPASKKRRAKKVEPVLSQAETDESDELETDALSDEEFDEKMQAIIDAENKRNLEKESQKKEDIYTKEKTIEELEKSVESVEPISSYRLPSLSFLKRFRNQKGSDSAKEVQEKATILIDTLESFGVEAELVGVTRGPTVTRYDIKPAIGVRINKITNLSADIALSLATTSIRIAPIPNKTAIGIEVPNSTKNTVGIRSLLESPEFEKMSSKKLTVALGENIAGEPQFADLAKMPHLLIAGTTGSGKSVCLNSMIISILYNAEPSEVQFIMIDPKGVELSVYNGIPHMPTPVVKNPHKAAGALAWAVKEMMNRYALFEQYKVKDIKSYNKLAKNDDELLPMTQFVIIIDELADLMMVAPGEVEDSICRLAQMARAAGMHLVIATQSPRADVITGLIKSNIPSRIALSVANGLESRIIIDQNGAEQLLGNGDMLFNPIGSNKPTRIQGCFVSEEEIEKITDFIKKQGRGEYDEEIAKQFDELAAKEKGKKSADTEPQGESDYDPLIEKAVEVILEYQAASTSFIQRKLSVGYARGARIIDELEQMGIIGPSEGAKPRKILITKDEWLERNAMKPDDQIALTDDMGEDEEEE
ncbi:MAG: DNA translocase FtsK [Ruminococcaceae bacterium]|nr:DNA translocase FtsK [Oscillospiraceae bacterium]